MRFSARSTLLLTIATLAFLTQAIKIQQLHQTSSAASLMICPESYVFDPKLMRCVCPSDKPHVNLIGDCVACASPGVWNPTIQSCVKCVNGKFNNQTE